MKNKQIKAQHAINSDKLEQKTITISQTDNKHIEAKPGFAYQIVFQQENKVLVTDFAVLAKKEGEDLTLLLEGETTVVFENYFATCVDLSCVVSLPAEDSLYHIINNQFKVLEDGTKMVYLYGDKAILNEIISSNNTLSEFLDQSHASPSSSWSLPTIGLSSLAAVAVTKSSGGSPTDDGVKFNVKGNISAGQVIKGHDFKLALYGEDGEELKEYKATIQDDGSFNIQVKKDYTGYLILKLTNGTNKDYKDEATGEEKALSVELRTIAMTNGGNITAMINPLTEIIVRKVLGNESKLKEVSDVKEELSKINSAIVNAFNIEGVDVDISSTNPAVVNADDYNTSASAESKAIGYTLAGISGMEVKDLNGDTTKTTGSVLTELVGAIDNNGVFDGDARKNFLAGLKEVQVKNLSNMPIDSYNEYNEKFKSSIVDIIISDDTKNGLNGDTDDDFITQKKSQTITATLEESLGDKKLWGSVDSGVTWVNITDKVSNLNISWDYDLKEREDDDQEDEQYMIQFGITSNTINTESQVTNNIEGMIAQKSYTLDTKAPDAAKIEKITSNNKIIPKDGTTNETQPKIYVSLKDTGAKEGDSIQIFQNGFYVAGKDVLLSKTDVSSDQNYIEITPSSLSVGSNNDNKDYSFQVRIVDKVGNQSALSDAYLITYDLHVDALTLALKDDTGVGTSDGVTNNKKITIGNIEKDSKVEYILDGSQVWLVLDKQNIIYDDNDKGTVDIDLNEDTDYAAGKIKVKQTDKAGNEKITENQEVWKIDNTQVEYDSTQKEKIFRVKNSDTDAFESHIVLSFTENIFRTESFDKDSFSVFIGNKTTKSTIRAINVQDKKITIIVSEDMQAANTNALKLFYTQTDKDKSFQDKAGNLLKDIGSASSPIAFTFDKDVPAKPVIVKITDNVPNKNGEGIGEVADGSITDDNDLTIKTSFSSMKVGDYLKYYNTTDGEEKEVKKVVLTQMDIDRNYTSITLYLGVDGKTEGVSYELSVKAVDKAGNVSDPSNVRKFTIDSIVAQAKIELAIDSGSSTSDGKTNDNHIEVSNIEKGATWKYSVDGGDNWIDGDGGSVNDIGLEKKFDFELEQNKTYDRGDIIVKQTDRAGNTNGDERHTTAPFLAKTVVTDNIQPEYQSLRVLGGSSQIVLSFSDQGNLNTTTVSSSGVKDAFTVTVGSSSTRNAVVSKAVYSADKVTLTVDSIADNDDVKVVYDQNKFTNSRDTYKIKDIAGNLVDNFQIGSSNADTLTGSNVNDTLVGNSGDDTLTGNGGNDTLRGGEGNDTLTGGTGDDRLTGGEGNDTLTGGEGNDTLTGGTGDDTLTGGTGVNTFDYNVITGGNDTITDFTQGSDILDFKDLLVNYGSNSTLSEFIRSEQSGGNTTIKVDANGAVGNSGTFNADIEITLTSISSIDLSAMIVSGNLIVL